MSDSQLIELQINDRLGTKTSVKVHPDDTVLTLKKLIASKTGTRWDRIVLKKWYSVLKNQVSVGDYELCDGMNLEMYYQ